MVSNVVVSVVSNVVVSVVQFPENFFDDPPPIHHDPPHLLHVIDSVGCGGWRKLALW